jgi:hypothetical protein
VSANSTTTFSLPPGDYAVAISQLARNCTLTDPVQKATLSAGAVTDVTFNITCVPAGGIRVSATISGTDAPPTFPVVVDGVFIGDVGGFGSVSVVLDAGVHAVALQPLPANCVVIGANPVTVSVPQGVTTNVAFSVSCVANPTLRVTVTATGTNIPATFYVGVDDYNFYYYVYTFLVPANGSGSIRLPVGSHLVVLEVFPATCTVTGGKGRTVEMQLGATVDVAYTVVCQ